MKRLYATEIRKLGVKCNKNDLDLIGIIINHAKKV